MSSSEVTSQEERPQKANLAHGTQFLRQAKPTLFSICLFVIPLIIFSIVQYLRYGFGLFLGWDSSTYAWAASMFSTDPIHYLHLASYPSLYVVILSAFSVLMGQVSVAEKILPFIVALPLGYAYYRLTLDATSDRRLGYLAALLGGLTINTLRLESDLNRNLLSFSVSMFLGFLLANELGKPSFSLRTRWKRLLLVWLPLLAVVAYSQIETYLVLSLSLLLLVSLTRNLKVTAFTTLLVALPIIVALPLIWTFLLDYPAGIKLIAFAPVSTLSVLAEVALYLGGFALPCTVFGLMTISESARRRNLAALFVVSWLAILVILLPVAVLAGLPYDRFLYLVPVPLILAAGLKPLILFGSSLGARHFHVRFLGGFRLKILRKSLIPIGLTLLVIATIVTSVSTTDSFLRPYVTQNDISRLSHAAKILRQEGFTQPILVMYGPVAADVNPIYRAYFDTDFPDGFAYYGKLQYLFTLPNPSDVYSWQYDPSFEMTSSLRYRTEILNQLGNVALASHPIVIAGGDTYDRPLSEVFVRQFETSTGSGIYIIPPNALQPNQLDSWRLYAYSDWTTKTASYAANATWAQAPQVLGYLGRGSGSQFNANYSISLTQTWSNMTLMLSFFDYPRPFIFPDTTNATLAPIQILFDNQLLLTHNYADLHASTITLPLKNVAWGVHTVTIRSISNSTRPAVAVALDEIQVCPLNCG